MIHFLNRKQLLSDLEISIVAQAREVLLHQGIEVKHCIKRGDDSVAYATKNQLSHEVSKATRSNIPPRTFVHILYVKKQDYDTAYTILEQANLL